MRVALFRITQRRLARRVLAVEHDPDGGGFWPDEYLSERRGKQEAAGKAIRPNENERSRR